jgi:hypothetical protein
MALAFTRWSPTSPLYTVDYLFYGPHPIFLPLAVCLRKRSVDPKGTKPNASCRRALPFLLSTARVHAGSSKVKYVKDRQQKNH